MIKKYLEARKIKKNIKQHRKGYEYACGCLIRREKTTEELESESAFSKPNDINPFNFGIIDAMEDLYFYCNFQRLTNDKKIS